jgi:hypothetical protein
VVRLRGYSYFGGRKPYAEARPDTVALAKQLHADGLSYRKIAAELAARGQAESRMPPPRCKRWFTPGNRPCPTFDARHTCVRTRRAATRAAASSVRRSVQSLRRRLARQTP